MPSLAEFFNGLSQERTFTERCPLAVFRFDGRRIEDAAVALESLPDATPVRQRECLGSDRALATEQEVNRQ